MDIGTVFFDVGIAVVVAIGFAVFYREGYRNGLGRPLKPKHLDPDTRYMVEDSMVILGRDFAVLSDADDLKDKFRWCKVFVPHPKGTLVVFEKDSAGNIICQRYRGKEDSGGGGN